MQIRFNPKVGETYDFFLLPHFVYNHDEYNSLVGEYGIELSEEYEKFISELKQDVNLDERKFKLYYGKDFALVKVFLSNHELWHYIELDKCLNFVKQLDNDMLKFRLVRELIRRDQKSDDLEEIGECAKEISEDEQKSLALIKNTEYDSGLKWELFCFLQDPVKYRNEFLGLMEDLIPVFYKHYEPKRKAIEEFNRYIEGKLNDNKIDFLKELASSLFKYDIYDELFITTSYVNYYSINFNLLGNSSYIYLGIDFEETNAQYEGRKGDKLNKYINTYKNFSDATRFQILKLIVEEEEYSSKDIAEKLGITGATVSYHMNNLFTAELVSMNKKDRKSIYSVNKDVIQDAIEFLKRELEL